MDTIEMGTEQRIKVAARAVFQRKGFDGARMQEIADEAGINKALLHYYFRSKDQLFEIVFREAFLSIFPKIEEIMMEDKPLAQKIEAVVDKYMTFLQENPALPQFILHESQRNPERISKIIFETGLKPSLMIERFDSKLHQQWHDRIDPRHIVVNMLAMCIFPVVGRPLLQLLLFDADDDTYTRFMNERKQIITSFMLQGIKEIKNKHQDE